MRPDPIHNVKLLLEKGCQLPQTATTCTDVKAMSPSNTQKNLVISTELLSNAKMYVVVIRKFTMHD